MGGLVKGIAGWVALALAGLVLAAGVGVAARELSSQDVGLSAEPITVGEELAPAATAPEPAETSERTETEERSTADEPAPEPSTPSDDAVERSEEGEDDSGKGRGRGRSGDSGRGRGGDDD
jgi:hypothetical protein